MDNITITDKADISMMEDSDIRKWISLHQRALKDETMKEHWLSVNDDLNILKAEWQLRNPIVNVLEEMLQVMKQIENHLDNISQNQKPN